MSQHTPLPWMVGPPNTSNAAPTIISLTSIIADRVNWSGDAAFIVLACNAHDELVAALQNLLDSCQGSKVGFWTIPSDAAINAARAALAKVQS